MTLFNFPVKRKVTVYMLFIAIGLFGVISFALLPIDMFPEIETPMLSVITIYPGASAEEIEEKVTKRLEKATSPINNLEHLTSITKDNLSVVTLNMDFGTDMSEAANDVRSAIEFVKPVLPEAANDPTLFKLSTSAMPVLILSVTTTKGEILQYRDFVEERVAERLQRVSGVGAVSFFSPAVRQLYVDLDRESLSKFRISIQQVEQLLFAQNLSAPAGSVDIGRYTFPMRVPGEFDTLDDISGMIVGMGEMGQPIYLHNIADVYPATERKYQIAQVDGQDTMLMMVQKQSGANTVEVVKGIRSTLVELKKDLPSELDVKAVTDMSRPIENMIKNLSNTLLYGAIFVVLVVFIFLRRFKPSLIIMATIPGSMLGTFALLYLFDYTLNVVSLMAMAIAVGMVVDNSVVVLENISRHVERGKSSKEAATIGPQEVGQAITASTLTTICIFAPVAFVGGFIGIMAGQLSFVIVATVGTSLLTALLLTPAMASHLLTPPKTTGLTGWWIKHSGKIFNLLENGYSWLLRISLKVRWAVILVALGIMGFTAWLISEVGTEFMGKQDSGEVQMLVELPVGTRVEETAAVAERIEAEVIKDPDIDMSFYRAGDSGTGFSSSMGGKEGSNVVELYFHMKPRGERERMDYELASELSKKFEDWPEIVNLSVFSGSPMSRMMSGGGNKPLVIKVLGENWEELTKAAVKVEDILNSIEGVRDVGVLMFQTKPDLFVDLDRRRVSLLGLNSAVIADTVRTAMYGKVVTRYRGGEEDIDLFLRFEEEDRDEIADIEAIEVISQTGELIPIRRVGEVKEGESIIEIQREDKTRLITVSADFSGRPLGDVISDLEKKMDESRKNGDFSAGITVNYGGQIESQKDVQEDLALVLLLAIVLVYMVMAGQFESLLDPFVIMFSLPFAFTGAFLGLMITGLSLSMNAFLGLIILMGIVVNNAIVLVDYIQLLRSRGLEISKAIVEAGRTRLRPVLMTAFTTSFGMLPMATLSDEGSELWNPIGVCVIGGLLFSTLVTLVLIPTIYSLFEFFRINKYPVEETS